MSYNYTNGTKEVDLINCVPTSSTGGFNFYQMNNGATALTKILSIDYSGNVGLVGNLYVNSTSISPTVLSYLSRLSSHAQTQITNLQIISLIMRH